MANERVIKELIISPQLSIGDRETNEIINDDIELFKATGNSSLGFVGLSSSAQLEFDQTLEELTVSVNASPVLSINEMEVVILGNLTVEGSTTMVDSTVVTIADNIFLLNKDEPGPGVTLLRAGIEIERGPVSDNAGWFFNETEMWWGPAGPSGSLESGVGITNTLGNVNEINTTTGSNPEILTITGSGALTVPSGTDGERPGSPVEGMVRYNETSDVFELYNGSWSAVSAPPASDGFLLRDGTNDITGDIAPDMNDMHDLGTTGLRFNTIYATTFDGTATAAFYADLAERYAADATYEPGTVLIFGGEAEVTTTNVRKDTRIAGIVSTNPGFMLNKDAGPDMTHPYIALKGRVPCKVVGHIKKGDLLITSGIPGYAMSFGYENVEAYTVVGKALEDYHPENWDDPGMIEVFVI